MSGKGKIKACYFQMLKDLLFIHDFGTTTGRNPRASLEKSGKGGGRTSQKNGKGNEKEREMGMVINLLLRDQK